MQIFSINQDNDKVHIIKFLFLFGMGIYHTLHDWCQLLHVHQVLWLFFGYCSYISIHIFITFSIIECSCHSNDLHGRKWDITSTLSGFKYLGMCMVFRKRVQNEMGDRKHRNKHVLLHVGMSIKFPDKMLPSLQCYREGSFNVISLILYPNFSVYSVYIHTWYFKVQYEHLFQ